MSHETFFHKIYGKSEEEVDIYFKDRNAIVFISDSLEEFNKWLDEEFGVDIESVDFEIEQWPEEDSRLFYVAEDVDLDYYDDYQDYLDN